MAERLVIRRVYTDFFEENSMKGLHILLLSSHERLRDDIGFKFFGKRQELLEAITELQQHCKAKSAIKDYVRFDDSTFEPAQADFLNWFWPFIICLIMLAFIFCFACLCRWVIKLHECQQTRPRRRKIKAKINKQMIKAQEAIYIHIYALPACVMDTRKNRDIGTTSTRDINKKQNDDKVNARRLLSIIIRF